MKRFIQEIKKNETVKTVLEESSTLSFEKPKNVVRKPRIKLFTKDSHWGAEVDDSVAEGLPVVNIPLDSLVGFEPDEKMDSIESSARVQEMVALIKQDRGNELAPILVRNYNGGYQVLDGHHRFQAYKITGAKTIPVKIVPEEEIEIVN